MDALAVAATAADSAVVARSAAAILAARAGILPVMLSPFSIVRPTGPYGPASPFPSPYLRKTNRRANDLSTLRSGRRPQRVRPEARLNGVSSQSESAMREARPTRQGRRELLDHILVRG